VPEPPLPECPDAGPEVCGEEPPPEGVPPDSDDDTNGNGNGNGNGEDESNGNGEGDVDSNGYSNGEFFGGRSFFDNNI
jgi:hypothetical protein